MVAFLLTVLGLSLAGLDPAGALIAVAALAAGAARRTVLVYGLVVLLGTALLGTLLSLTAGRQLADVDWSGLVPAGQGGALLELLVGALLLGWAALRVARPNASAPKPRRRRTGAGLALVGVLFAASATADPTFVGVVVVAGRGEPWWLVAVAHLLWAVLSQLPLTALLLAVATGRHERLVVWFQGWWARARGPGRRALTGLLLAAGLFVTLDAAWFLATGEFLVPGPE